MHTSIAIDKHIVNTHAVLDLGSALDSGINQEPVE
jgi:hypothetical protein